jgi:zinc and cadmium transporter
MVELIIYAILFSFLNSSLALVLLFSKKGNELAEKIGIPFAAGSLLSLGFINLLPEGLELGANIEWLLIGFVIFYIINMLFHSAHHHDDGNSHIKNHGRVVSLALGDALHGLIDGLAVGIAFLASVESGVITLVAIMAHEIPQEVAEYSIMLKSGLSKMKIVYINMLSSVLFLLAAILIFQMGASLSDEKNGALHLLAAGAIIFVAASDLVPTLLKAKKDKFTNSAVALVGLIVVYVASKLV